MKATASKRLQIHPTATIEDGAILPEDSFIGAGSFIGREVRLGRGCHVHQNVVIDGETTIGEECEIFPFAVLGVKPQDKKLKPGDSGGRLLIGSHNVIREHVTIHGGTPYGSGITTVGDHNMLLVGCHIGHDVTVGDYTVFTNGAMVAGHCRIEDHVILGAMVGIHQHARVGAWAMIGAGSMLSLDAPPFSLVQGDRARLISVNVIGMKRGGFTEEQKRRIKKVYRILFWRDGQKSQRLSAAREYAGDDPLCAQIIDFVDSTTRGVLAPREKPIHGAAGAGE